jgi:hypothetical protein
MKCVSSISGILITTIACIYFILRADEFRVIKLKVGFELYPVVLEGLARITHLMNIDMVEDLIVLLRAKIDGSEHNMPDFIRLMCVHCALSTLSGPGQELNIDDEPFVIALRNLMSELPGNFDKWDKVLECVELCVIKHREARSVLVVAMVRLLIAISPHMATTNAGITAVALAHCILLRYPRARQSFEALRTVAQHQIDDDVGDLAMVALRNSEANCGDLSLAGTGDGSWMLPLLKMHVNKRFHNITDTISSRGVTPIPLRTSDATSVSAADHFNGIEKLFTQMENKGMMNGSAPAAGGKYGEKSGARENSFSTGKSKKQVGNKQGEKNGFKNASESQKKNSKKPFRGKKGKM